MPPLDRGSLCKKLKFLESFFNEYKQDSTVEEIGIQDMILGQMPSLFTISAFLSSSVNYMPRGCRTKVVSENYAISFRELVSGAPAPLHLLII